MVLILIVSIFTSIFIFACIEGTRGDIDYNHSCSEVPTKYHMDDKFMLCNYMNYQKSKQDMNCALVKKEIKYSTKHKSKRSSEARTYENSNLKVIRGNKK